MQAGLVPCTSQPSGRCKSWSRRTPHSAGTSGSHQFHIVSQGCAHRWILQAGFCSSGHAEAATSQKPPEHLSCPHAPVRHTGPIPTATICMDEGCSGLEQGCPCCCLQCSPRTVCTRSPNIPLAYGGLSKSRRDEPWLPLGGVGDPQTLKAPFVLLLEKDFSQHNTCK